MSRDDKESQKRPRAQLTARAWNVSYPVGTPVRFWPGVRSGDGELAVTRSEAWELGDGTPVVAVEGRAGGIALSHVEVDEEAACRMGPTPAITLGKREFGAEMHEVSGFGGGYEGACRTMVLAGLAWLEKHTEADLQFSGYENVYGVINANTPDGEAMIKAMVAAAEVYGKEHGEGGVTGAMVQATITHALTAGRLGWEGYVAEMVKPAKEQV